MAGTAKSVRRRCTTRGSNAAARCCALAIAVLLLSFASLARAQQKPKDEECLACHSDSTLTTEVNGKRSASTVDAIKSSNSIHGEHVRMRGLPQGCEGLVA